MQDDNIPDLSYYKISIKFKLNMQVAEPHWDRIDAEQQLLPRLKLMPIIKLRR